MTDTAEIFTPESYPKTAGDQFNFKNLQRGEAFYYEPSDKNKEKWANLDEKTYQKRLKSNVSQIVSYYNRKFQDRAIKPEDRRVFCYGIENGKYMVWRKF